LKAPSRVATGKIGTKYPAKSVAPVSQPKIVARKGKAPLNRAISSVSSAKAAKAQTKTKKIPVTSQE
jgi:hypothetical protein